MSKSVEILAQFKIPGQSGQQEIVVPSGIPKELSGGLDTTGASFFQVGYQFVFYAAIVLAVIFLMFSGIQMITSGGDSEKLTQARRRMTFAIVGLTIVLLAFLIVSIILSALGLDSKLFIN
ncbi:hypothetical protein HYS97_00060 [Candidatus Daviesbacteria bacterium]|nr:hypothetical protein [Candidatus Daviesbacteria bacterium]